MIEPPTSVTLLGRICDDKATDDPQAWPRFVKVYGPMILAWCRRKGLQEHDAQEVTQEVLFTWYRQCNRFRYDSAGRFRGYLRRLTHAAWCDWVERQSGRRMGTGDTAVQRVLEAVPAREDWKARLEEEFDHERLEQAMRRVRERVEASTWMAFRLLALEGLSGQESAARLGMKLGATYAARCKVQRMIRQELARHETFAAN